LWLRLGNFFLPKLGHLEGEEMTTRVIEIERGNVVGNELKEVPELSGLFMPCPICRGTTDVDYDGIVFCCSCGQRWTIFGKPLDEAAPSGNGKEATAEDYVFA
jgi:hypothetical protein